ncbi:MAG: hypothetical protein LJE65_01655, partial [Desulfobacteraceae bacterium]|nr:hypothetical protein [Desulfobacteraceae bacterium]
MIYKRIVNRNLPIALMFSTVFLPFLLVLLHAAPGEPAVRKEEFIRFEEAVSLVARQYIGTPYGWVKSAGESGAVDNSHLFHL